MTCSRVAHFTYRFLTTEESNGNIINQSNYICIVSKLSHLCYVLRLHPALERWNDSCSKAPPKTSDINFTTKRLSKQKVVADRSPARLSVRLSKRHS